MKVIARSLVVIFVALIAVPALAVSYTITSAVQLLATTALIMGGTQHPLSSDVDDPNTFVLPYMNKLLQNLYVDSRDPEASEPNPAGINKVAVIYPAEFFPFFGSTTFDDSVSDGVDNLGSCLGVNDDDCNYNHDVRFGAAGYRGACSGHLYRHRLLAKRSGGLAGEEPDHRGP